MRLLIHAETDTTVVLDGQRGLGHFLADQLTRGPASKCREWPIAMGGIIHGPHIGCLGEWSKLAADLGVMLYVSLGSASGAMTAIYGAAEGRMGTNPITFGVPGLEGDAFVMDFATSAAAESKIRVARDSGKSVSEGWLRDAADRSTTDPNDFGRATDTLAVIQRQFTRLRAAAPAQGSSDVQAPGDFERRSRAALASGSLQIPEPTWECFLQAADKWK